MAKDPDIDTLSTYYRTLRAPAKTGGKGSLSEVLGALLDPGTLAFDDLRRATAIPPVELGDVLRSLQDLNLVEIHRAGGDEEVKITPEGERFASQSST